MTAIASTAEVSLAVARRFGATVHEVRRQTRWRPTWFVYAERDGEPFDVVVRGERVDTSVLSLRHEVEFHRLLEDHGIPVPEVHGWIDELEAVCLELVPGKPDFDGVPEADRDTIVDEYLQVLARVHALPIEPFVERGIMRADDPANSAMVGHLHMERLYRSKKDYPDPFLEFCLGWLHRHPPRSGGRETPMTWDTGQFHHVDGHLRAVLDLEFGHVGDVIVEADLDDLRPLLGFRPDTWQEGDAALERFVLADAEVGKHDEELVRLFHRRNLRVHMQLGPSGSKMVRHLPTQRFGG